MPVEGTGAYGEFCAAKYLKDNGYAILEMNYRCRFGEIDIIAQKDGIVAFVEVKTRENDRFASAAENVTPEKLRRIVTTAGLWISKHQTQLQPRFDVIEVYSANPSGQPERIEHIKNVWMEK